MGSGVFFFTALVAVQNEPVLVDAATSTGNYMSPVLIRSVTSTTSFGDQYWSLFLPQKPVLYTRALMIQMRWLFASGKAVSSVLVGACAAWKTLGNT